MHILGIHLLIDSLMSTKTRLPNVGFLRKKDKTIIAEVPI